MTEAQERAIEKMQANGGGPTILHVRTGDALVEQGLATKDDTSGHGRLKAAYRIK